jgi:hypothetical protein
MVLGLGYIFGRSEPKLPEGVTTRLPDYFPVEPKGCERVSQELFKCVTETATEKARDIEKAGLHSSYYPDVVVEIKDPHAASVAASSDDPTLPKKGDNPLDVCRKQIAYYQQCCDRELKKKKNWILTEPYRVQEEYRYNKANSNASK